MIHPKLTVGMLFLIVVAMRPVLAQETPAQASVPPIRVAAAEADPLSKDALFGTTAEPKSKDALFGTTADPEPKSKDALFGAVAAEKPGVKLSGSFEGLGAYTYADPTHASRAVGRLALVARGEIAENIKWKLSGRFDADLVYASSGFYLDSVKRNQRATAVWGENYFDVSAGSWDFRLGAQQIVWGEVVGLFFADVVSARDTREFLLPSFEVIRIPQWAARAEYFAGDAHLELVWIPVPTFDRIGKPGADFYPAPGLPSPTPASVAALFHDPERPDRTLRNSNYGVRANTLVSGWDLAAFYYRSFSTQPTFYRLPTGTPGQPFVFEPRYDRIWQVGGTVSKDLGEMVLRAETVYASGQRYSVTNPSVAQGVVQRSTLDAIVSVEFPLPGDTRLNLQGFQRTYYNGGGGAVAIKSDGFGATVFLSTKLTAAFEPQILWVQNFKNGGGWVRPRLNWFPAKNTTVGFGVDIFTGPSDGYFGRYNNRDRVYSEVRLDF